MFNVLCEDAIRIDFYEVKLHLLIPPPVQSNVSIRHPAQEGNCMWVCIDVVVHN